MFFFGLKSKVNRLSNFHQFLDWWGDQEKTAPEPSLCLRQEGFLFTLSHFCKVCSKQFGAGRKAVGADGIPLPGLPVPITIRGKINHIENPT